MSANERQVAGTHYGLGTYQHWDMVADLRLGYFEGQITKYVSRWRKKNGLQDLQKADHFLQKLLEQVTQHGWGPRGSATGGYSGTTRDGRHLHALEVLDYYCAVTELDKVSAAVVRRVATWALSPDLFEAHGMLRALIDDQLAAEPGAGYVNQG